MDHVDSPGEPGSATTSAPTVRVFGGVGLDDGGPVSVGGPRQRRLLALFALRSDAVLTIDWLAEYLWDDDDRPDVPARSIRTYVSRLRSAFPDAARDWIETEGVGYRFAAPADRVEHRRFALLRDEATRARNRGDPGAAVELLDEALALWRGEPFPEFDDLDIADGTVEQLRLDRLEMLEERWEATLALGRHTQIIGELAAFTHEHGLRDRATRQYALALHRSGRTTEALRVIDDHRRLLAEQSGLDPTPELVELERAILAGDPALQVERTGRPLRGYRLLEEAGTGAFSIVWRGVQPSVDRDVAIKQIRSELASQPEFIRRFEAEAHLVARIEHPHIVPLIDYWRDPDSAYLVMRWLPGGTLERRLDDGALTVAETLSLARQVGGALSAAHRRGIIHRDIKPANILFDDESNAFLTDFGIALEASATPGPLAELSSGSPAYASPEQLRREQLGPEADVFSLGVVVFESLTGELPFADSASVDELVDRQLHAPYPALSELRSDVPPAIVGAVARATSKDPAERFTSVDEFVDALTADASAAEHRGRSDHRDTTEPLGEIENPYRGLLAFDDGDVERFFGRRRLIAALLARLDGQHHERRCVVVVGPSGSGKSSVVRAGLVPALRGGAVDGSDTWFTTTMTPGAHPYESLEAALLRVAVNPPTSLLAQLRDGRRGILRTVRRCVAGDGQRLLLVIDQFEELFTSAPADIADAFLAALTVALDDPASPLVVVATLRADYYDRPLQHPTFSRLLDAGSVNVTPLAADELEQAIVEPARRVGVEFEPGLVARIAAETIGQPSPLPLLQYALRELFERRSAGVLTIDAYDEIGGLSGALAARADELYAEADDEGRAAIRRLFGRLTDPGQESADLRRRIPVSDAGDDPATQQALERFGSARLLSFDRDVTTRVPTVEVAHEALLREWPRLVRWLRDDAELLRTAHSVAVAAGSWDVGGREPTDLIRGGRLEIASELALAHPERLRPVDREFVQVSRAASDADRQRERRRVRRLRRLVVAVAAALVIALVAAGVALRQRDQAQAASERADLATIISRSAAVSNDQPEVSILLALEALRRSPGPETEFAVLDALGRSPLGNTVATFDPIAPDNRCDVPPIVARDGLSEYVTTADALVRQDLTTGDVTEHGPPPAPCALWFGDEAAGRRFAFTIDDPWSLWFGEYDGPWQEIEPPEDLVLLGRSFAGDRLMLVSAQPPLNVYLLDAATGELVGSPTTDLFLGEWGLSWGISSDGTVAAIGQIVPDSPDEQFGQVIVLDAATAEERFSVDLAVPATSLVFDTEHAELLAATDDGRVITVDLRTGDIVGDVGTTATSTITALGFRPDGLLVVVSEGQIELVDRDAGPRGTPVTLRNAVETRVRPDGTVLAMSNTGAIDIVDTARTALVEQIVEVDPLAPVAFGAGRAAVAGAAGDVELIDLSTGGRTELELTMPDGREFDVVAAFPEPDGVLAIDGDATIARWIDGAMTEQVSVGFGVQPNTDSVAFAAQGALVGWTGNGYAGYRLDTTPGQLGVSVAVARGDDEVSAAPAPDGGLHIMRSDGVLRTYDTAGHEMSAIETGIAWAFALAGDERTGRLAVGGIGGAAVVDPATGDVVRITGAGPTSSVGFADDGALVVLVGEDGTVRLWDVARGESAGLVWDGSGGAPTTPPWYDVATDSLWVVTSGKLLRVPLTPDRWVERACEIVPRGFTDDEAERFVPGGDPPPAVCG